jgi:arylsulfatase
MGRLDPYTEHPADGSVQAMRGASMSAVLAGQSSTVHDEDYVTVHAHGGRVALRQGRRKLTNLDKPFDESRLKLFDLGADPGETRNLAEAMPERYEAMLELWRVERLARGIVLPQDL